MRRFLLLYRSIVGRKMIAAATGLVLLGFLLVHAFGNLNSFAGINAEGVPAINDYAVHLHKLARPLVPASMLVWLFRILLAAAFILHVVAVFSLLRINRRARRIDYLQRQQRHTSLAAGWVVISGVLLLVFIVTHVTQFAFGVLTPFDYVAGDIYYNLHAAFSHGWLVLFYLAALAALGLHLRHGIWSLCQTLGVDNPDRNRALRMISSATAVLLVMIYASIPLAYYFSMLPPTP